MSGGGRARLALPPGTARSRLALGSAAAVALVLALSPGDLAPASLRAAAAAGAVGAAALLARGGTSRKGGPDRLAVVSRQLLSREAGVALLEVDGRPILVGFAGAGVQLLRAEAPGPPQPPSVPPTERDS